MKAHDVMTWGAISIEADAPAMQAAQLMLQNKISGLPVVDAQGGVLTDAGALTVAAGANPITLT